MPGCPVPPVERKSYFVQKPDRSLSFFYWKKKTLFKNVNLTVAVAPKAYTASAENHLGRKKKKKKTSESRSHHAALFCFLHVVVPRRAAAGESAWRWSLLRIPLIPRRRRSSRPPAPLCSFPTRRWAPRVGVGGGGMG